MLYREIFWNLKKTYVKSRVRYIGGKFWGFLYSWAKKNRTLYLEYVISGVRYIGGKNASFFQMANQIFLKGMLYLKYVILGVRYIGSSLYLEQCSKRVELVIK